MGISSAPVRFVGEELGITELFIRIIIPHLRAHRIRTALTVLGVALGVMLIVGLRLLYAAIDVSFDDTVQRMAGDAVLQISNAGADIPEELLEQVKSVEGVEAAAASVQGSIPIVGREGDRLFIFGVDLLAERGVREYEFREVKSADAKADISDPLIFLAKADSVALTAQFLSEAGLSVGDRIELMAPAGRTKLRIRSALDIRRGPASLFDGRMALMDIFAAQRLFDLDHRFSRIDVSLKRGADLGAVEAALNKIAAGRASVERTAAAAQSLRGMLAEERRNLTGNALIPVFIGLYMIFNTMAIAVVQRQREMGILRALGMRARGVMSLVAAEALALGAAGCAVGVPAGYYLAKSGVNAFFAHLDTFYRLTIERPTISLELGAVLWGVSLGLSGALAAALVPAWSAARLHPLKVLRPAAGSSPRSAAFGGAALAGLGFILLGLAAWLLRRVLPMRADLAGFVSMDLILFGISLAAPFAIRALAARLDRVAAIAPGPIVSLASRGITANVGRLAITCSVFLVSLALVVKVYATLSHAELSFERIFESTLGNTDLVVTAGAPPMSRSGIAVPESVADEIAKLPGVARVGAWRSTFIPYQGMATEIRAIDVMYNPRALNLIDGDPRRVAAAMAKGEGVLVSSIVAAHSGLRRGGRVVLTTPSGRIAFPILGICEDEYITGKFEVARGLYERLWRDHTVDFIQVTLAPGADHEAVAGDIRRRFGGRYDLFVATLSSFRDQVHQLIGQAFSFFSFGLLLMVVIVLFGLLNSLTASVLDRVRQIGMLRAVGMTRGQVARWMVLEAAFIGLISGGCAAVVGPMLDYYDLYVLGPALVGVRIFYQFPLAAMGLGVVAATMLAAAGGYLPGRSAARIVVTQALQTE